jgi:hypothetical protein
VYQPISGDGAIVARVVSIQGGGGDPKAGVMIRETLGASSTNAYMFAYNDTYSGTLVTGISSSDRVGMTRHPKLGAVERQTALSVNVLAPRALEKLRRSGALQGAFG